MNDPDMTEALSTLPLFSKVNPDTIKLVAKHATTMKVPKNYFVFHQGDQCEGFFSVISGKIKIIFTSAKGKEHVARILGPGEPFAEAVMFLDKPCPASTQAIVDSTVLFIPKNVIHQSIDADPRFARELLAGLSMRLHGLIIEIESLTTHSGKQRVIGYLLNLAESESSQMECNFPVSKALVAQLLNLTPESLSRILHELCEQGLIEMEGRSIRIIDLERLRELF